MLNIPRYIFGIFAIVHVTFLFLMDWIDGNSVFPGWSFPWIMSYVGQVINELLIYYALFRIYFGKRHDAT